MPMREDERRLADLFLQITKIPKEKLEAALEENNIRQILINPALLSPTVSQLSRIQTLQEFRSRCITLDHFEKKYQICGPSDAAAYLRPTLADREYEIAVGLLLDTRNNVIKQLTLGEGTLDSAVALFCGMHPVRNRIPVRIRSAGIESRICRQFRRIRSFLILLIVPVKFASSIYSLSAHSPAFHVPVTISS